MSPNYSGLYLLDADAFLGIRSLGLIEPMKVSVSMRRPVIITEYVARHELSSISQEIAALEACGFLDIRTLPHRDANFRRMKDGGADKGEAELVAWCLTLQRDDRPLLITVDRGARNLAAENRVLAGDLLDLVIGLIDLDVLTMESARMHTFPWVDRRQQRGRPDDFTTFDEAVSRRRAIRASRIKNETAHIPAEEADLVSDTCAHGQGTP